LHHPVIDLSRGRSFYPPDSVTAPVDNLRKY
jgi:hypothetical protein